MPEIWAGQLGELRAASTAGGGTSLTTTATYIQLPLKSNHIFITPRSFTATTLVAKVTLNPWLVVLKTTDAMTTMPVDYSNAAQDASTSTDVTVTDLNTVANGDFLLVGSHLPFRGVYFDVDDANDAGTATVAVYYWNGNAWANTSATVTGIRSTMVWDKDGLAYWTVPSAWVVGRLVDIYPNIDAETAKKTYATMPLYWTRWGVDALLEADGVTFNSMVAANRSTAYAELLSGQCLEQRIKHGEIGGIGCVEALTAASTAKLLVNVSTVQGGRYS